MCPQLGAFFSLAPGKAGPREPAAAKNFSVDRDLCLSDDMVLNHASVGASD